MKVLSVYSNNPLEMILYSGIIDDLEHISIT